MKGWPLPHHCSTHEISLCAILFHRTHLKMLRKKVENRTSVGRELEVWLGLDEEGRERDTSWKSCVLFFCVHKKNVVISLPRDCREWRRRLLLSWSPFQWFPWVWALAESQALGVAVRSGPWVLHLQNGESGLLFWKKNGKDCGNLSMKVLWGRSFRPRFGDPCFSSRSVALPPAGCQELLPWPCLTADRAIQHGKLE